jgi:hypothetical protein
VEVIFYTEGLSEDVMASYTRTSTIQWGISIVFAFMIFGSGPFQRERERV